MTKLTAARGLFYRLADAVSFAWRQDRVFRGAVIGMGVTLTVLVLRPGVSRQDRVLPPLETSSAGMPALMNPTGGGMMLPAQGPVGQVPKIAPGHPLGDVTVTPTPTSNDDHFGTIMPGHHS